MLFDISYLIGSYIFENMKKNEMSLSQFKISDVEPNLSLNSKLFLCKLHDVLIFLCVHFVMCQSVGLNELLVLFHHYIIIVYKSWMML